jgi:uncharacterized damage-inducible protein DinB
MPGDFAERDSIRVMLLRDLRALDREIAAYPDDASVWVVAPGISNSAGALAQHLCGNLRHFIGAVLGGTGYIRNRDAEFSAHDRTRSELQAELQRAIDDVARTLDQLSVEVMTGVYPVPLQDRRVRTSEFLVHLAVHLTYHLGQIDYHRRLLTTANQSVDAMSIHELSPYEGSPTN